MEASVAVTLKLPATWRSPSLIPVEAGGVSVHPAAAMAETAPNGRRPRVLAFGQLARLRSREWVLYAAPRGGEPLRLCTFQSTTWARANGYEMGSR